MPLQRVIAIDDGINDVSLLKKAGLAVAMGNRVEEAKSITHTVTHDVKGYSDGALGMNSPCLAFYTSGVCYKTDMTTNLNVMKNLMDPGLICSSSALHQQSFYLSPKIPRHDCIGARNDTPATLAKHVMTTSARRKLSTFYPP